MVIRNVVTFKHKDNPAAVALKKPVSDTYKDFVCLIVLSCNFCDKLGRTGSDLSLRNAAQYTGLKISNTGAFPSSLVRSRCKSEI
jgi:hypothetical protein